MIIYNAEVNGELKTVVTDGGKIISVEENRQSGDINAEGCRLIPGLIDVHTHGCIGMDTMDANFEPMCRFYAEHGTTSFLPTTMTMGYDSLLKVVNAKTDFAGANILGFHFEGPYISEKHKGAQNEKYIKNPSVTEFAQFKNVKMITLAPERPGSMEFIKAVTPDCIVSIGHTDCDFDTANEAIKNGADCLTHIYNAMPPFHHRNPGPIGAGFVNHIYAQIICDGFHISKPVVLATYKMFGPDRMTLISDSIRSAGLPDGEYESGGLKVFLKDGAARLADGTIAGSSATLLDCVKTAVKFGIPFNDAVRMASRTPAEMLGVNKGQIKPGFDADMLIVDSDINIKTVIINGEVFK